jgi:streptogramin lyase
VGLLTVLAAFVVLSSGLAVTRVGKPVVVGPRTTSQERPVYRFQAANARSYRCAFDSRSLHNCPARYSERLTPGSHVLRVRAIGHGGAMSPVVTVRVRITVPYARLTAGSPVRVGAGAGVPAVDGGSVWVPLTESGELARIDASGGTITAKTRVGAANGGAGFLDSAIAAGGSVWYASDAGGTISRVDASSGAPTATIPAGPRPGGLVAGVGFLGSDITRVDAATAAARTVHIEGVHATGIAYGGGSLWVLSSSPARILQVDPDSGATLATFELQVPFARGFSSIESWWLAYGEGGVWATLPDYEAVARLDVTTKSFRYARTPYGRPFGVATGAGSAWVATNHGVLRLDGATGAPTGVALLPAAASSGFASIAYGADSAWFANYDRGTLTRVGG